VFRTQLGRYAPAWRTHLPAARSPPAVDAAAASFVMMPPGKSPNRRARNQLDEPIATSLEVARAAGVSRATVSRCFTGGGLVRASTGTAFSLSRPLSATRRISWPRMLNKRESDIVAVLTADFRNPFQPALMEALTEGLCTDGLIPLLLKANSVDERADRSHPTRPVLPGLRDHRHRALGLRRRHQSDASTATCRCSS
jgi:hypothetical protein